MGTLGARTNTENKDFEPIRFISFSRTYYSFSYHTFIGISHDRSLQINEKENEFQKNLLAVKKSKWCYVVAVMLHVVLSSTIHLETKASVLLHDYLFSVGFLVDFYTWPGPQSLLNPAIHDELR